MIQLSFMMSQSAKKACHALLLLCILPVSVLAQDAIAPPTLGQETQGEPAIPNSPEVSQDSNDTSVEDDSADKKTSLFGKTEISELRRESGQVYRIELKHPNGSKQYIDEFDSDGKIESKDNDIEETPNLAKWRLGSW